MRLRKGVVRAFLLVWVALFPHEAWGQASTLPDLCNTNWFSAQTLEAAKENKTFLLMADSQFTQGDYNYVLAVKVPRSDEGPGVTLVIFAREHGTSAYDKIYEEEIPTVLLILRMMMEEKSPRCAFPHYGPWFDASVVDLDRNGRPELIVESNAAGTCSSCLSEVRVYQVQDGTVSKELEEAYNDIRFGPGKGLTLRSFQRGLSTDFIPIKKYFFVVPNK